MWRKLLISFIIIHVKLVVMQSLTTLPQNVQAESSSQPSEADKDMLQLVTNGESTNTQLLTHIQEILSSKQPTDQTTEVSSTDLDQQTIQDSSSYLDGTNNAITYLKELETGLPQSQDEVVPFKALSSDYLKKTSFVEEGKKNETYSERFVYMPSGKSEIIPCMDKIELKSTVKSITHVWEDHTGKKLKDRSRSRLKVDERYRLSINNVEVDDVGVYHCLLDIVYTDNGGETSIDNVVNLNVYVNPDLALEYPFIFESTTCDKERDRNKLNSIQSILCTTTPCVYQFEMTCSIEPWRHSNMPYIPRSRLLILATKYPDPGYTPPECNRDCQMGNKILHLLTNLEVVGKVIDMTVNDSNWTFFSGLTVQKLVYSCDAGFALFRESCVPCFPGTYNPKRRINSCVPCPMNTYTELPGARDCLQCQTGKRTEATGADSIKKCLDKEIQIIKFRMAFYVLCGIVGGLLAIILAIFIVKIRDRMKKFFRPDKPKETPNESAKLLTATQHEPPKKNIPQSMDKKPSKKKLSATIAEPETFQTVIQDAKEKLKKRPEETNETNRQGVGDTKASQAAVSNNTAHKGLATGSKQIGQLENKAKVTNQSSHTAAERPANQPEAKAKPDNFLGKLKRTGSQLSLVIRESVQDVKSVASDFTVPVSNKKPKATKLSEDTKLLTPASGSVVSLQPQLHDLARASQQLIRPNNLPLQPVITPSNAMVTSHQPSNLQTNTGSNLPNKRILPFDAPSDQSKAQLGHVPSGISKAQPTATPVGQIQPPHQPGPSRPNISSAQINSLSVSQQTQINPPQVGIPLAQLVANDQTQAFQTVALAQSSTNVSPTAGQLPQKALPNNLNQNAVFMNDSFSRELLKRKDLEKNYAERSYSIQDQASRGQHFAELSPPHYLYDQIFWMPNATTAPSHANFLSTVRGKASFFDAQGGHPSNSTFNQKFGVGYSNASGSQWNENGGEQNSYVASSYALQDPPQSHDAYSTQQPNYYSDSWPGYRNTGQQSYKGKAAGPEQ